MTEMAGVRLLDLYRDMTGNVWEVVGLCDRPQATLRNLTTGEQEEHVIGCLNWQMKFRVGPLRERRDA